jgi:hypothetical protein
MEEKDFADESQMEGESAELLETSPEKMIPESRVTELIKKAKWHGERKMQDQLEAARQEIEQLKAQQQLPREQVESMQVQPAQQQNSQAIDPQQIQQQVMQLIAQQRQEEEKQRQASQIEQEVAQVAQQYFGKMAQGKDLYDDFEAVTSDFNPADFPQLVFLANQMDNTAAIIYELRKNPGKLADLAVLVERSPNMAKSELNKLSQSILRNDEAKRNLQEPQDPMSRLKPSQAGTGAGEFKTVADFKNASYLRA